jgi:putative aldouronate transport system substrate-binding protein
VIAPSQGFKDKKQLVIASGDYPEVFLSGDFTSDEQLKYGKQGMLVPLNELIDTYAPNIKQALTDLPYLKQGITAPDGNIYSIPQVNECYHCFFGKKIWINQKWLDQLGLKMPTTTDEFEAVLLAFKEKDPNGNGKKDEIPLSGAVGAWHSEVTGFLMNAFVYNNELDYLRIQDGKVQTSANQPEWKSGLAYMNRLYKQGLIDPQSFTQNLEGLAQLGNNTGDAILGAYSVGHLGMVVNTSGDRHKDYTAVPPLKGPDGTQLAAYYKSVGNGRFAITNKASKEKAVAAIKLADYLYSKEGTWGQVFGAKGGMWDDADKGLLDFNGKQADIKVDPKWFTQTTRDESWAQAGPDYRPQQRFESQAVSQDILKDVYEVRLVKETKKYDGFQPKDNQIYPQNIFTEPADANKAVQLRTTINEYIKSNMVQFITGHKDLNKDWDAYVEGFNGLKLGEYLGILQKAYDTKAK